MLKHISFLILIVTFAFLLPHDLYATTTPCPNAGEVPATEADFTDMRAVGYTNPTIGMCWPKNSADLGTKVATAKQYLNTLWCGGVASTCSSNGTTYTSNIEQLDAKFALCMEKFLRSYRESDASTCITSAYRSTAHQRCSCGSGRTGCAAPGKSNHQRGIAIDLRVHNYGDMHSRVLSFPGGGLRYLNLANDPYHVEADKTGICGTGTALGNINTGIPTPGGILGGFSPFQQSIPQQPQQQPRYDTPLQALPAQSTPMAYYAPQTSTSTTNTYAQDADQYQSQQSISDLLKTIQAPTSTDTSSASGTAINLNNSLNDTYSLQPSEQQQNTAPTQTYNTYAQGSSFTSRDLKDSPIQPQGAIAGMLSGIKSTLLSISRSLTPFAGSPKLPTN